MSVSNQISKHFNQVYFGGNWTCSNLKEQLADVTWQEATTQIYGLNTLAILAFHISYFVKVASKVLEGGPLEGKDELSFDHPPILSQEDWEQFLSDIYRDAEKFTRLIEELPAEKLTEHFTDEKYGTYFRNLLGIIEHTHYHLGQIAIIKKLIKQ